MPPFAPRIFHVAMTSLLLSSCGISKQAPKYNSEPLKLDVVYPRLEGGNKAVLLPRIDSTFAFGSVQPANSKVFANGVAAKMYENGAFLAFFPLDTLGKRYNFLAIGPLGDSVKQAIPFSRIGDEPNTTTTGKVAFAHPINSKLPARIRIHDKHAHISPAPDQAYMILPPDGGVAWVDSFVAPFYRVSLKSDLHGWINQESVVLEDSPNFPPKTSIGAIVIEADSLWTRVKIPMKEPVLFQVQQPDSENVILIELFRATSKINQIKYDPVDEVIREIRWEQVNDEVVRLRILLHSSLWGYSARYENDELLVNIRKPPEIKRSILRNLVIAIDAGHGGTQPGAIGPTRLLEKDVDLAIANRLQQELIKKGARVIITRQGDATVDLYDRIDHAVEANAEILISIHNNALSDGENPFNRHGSSVFYFQPHAQDLAVCLHQSLVQATGLRDDGLYYKNLALARPSEMPAVLVECAYIMYPEEEQLLRGEAFQVKIARGLVEGMKNFLKDYRKKQIKQDNN
jgi:N-acetylmuramoyl-L-alanine amidase